MKNKLIRYCIVVLCVVAILFGLYKVLSVNKKLDTYLALGDYLSVSGNLKGEEITSFTTLLGDYFVEDNLVSNVNNNYVSSSYDSETLLEMISKDAYSGKDEGLVDVIKNSKYITISVGMNDIIDYIRFDSSKQKVIYDEEFIKRKMEIMKQNYYEIVEQIKDINERSKVYLVGYYFPYDWVEEECKEEANKVFLMLNEAIKDVSEVSDVYYVDISEVSKEDYMYSKNQIYLNKLGHEYVFNLFKEGYLD